MTPSPWMPRALIQAEKAAARGEIPVGVVLVHSETNSPTHTLLFEGHNQVETLRDPLAHGEMLAIRAGCHTLHSPYLSACDLYVTLEPCPMCAQALSLARVGRIIFGAYNPKGGGIDHGPRVLDASFHTWRPQVIGGVQEQACQRALKGFFQEMREKK